MKRTFLALMCIASIALMTACGNNKEQNTDKTSESAAESVEQAKGSAPESVTRTKWFSESENSTYRLTISVEDNANLFFTKYDDDGNLQDRIPKILAAKYPLSISKLMAYPLWILEPLCFPFSIILIKSTNAVKKRLQKKHTSEISIEDLSQAIELASDDLKDDREMLEDIVASSSLDAREVMTSRVDVFAIEYDSKFSKVIGDIVESGFSRIPVYEDNLDNVMGILYIKDVLAHVDEHDFDWHKLIRPHFIVPETKKINDLLSDFQSKKMHIAIVIDEYGGVSGIVTLEDILEEFVGEIHDEFDTDEDMFKKIDDRTYEFDAKTSIVDFCKIVNVDYELFQETKGESETLAGMLLEINQEIPAKNKTISIKDFDFTVTASNERRIKKIRVKLPKTENTDTDEK